MLSQPQNVFPPFHCFCLLMQVKQIAEETSGTSSAAAGGAVGGGRTAYDKYLEKQVRDKIEQKRSERITMTRRLPSVNKGNRKKVLQMWPFSLNRNDNCCAFALVVSPSLSLARVDTTVTPLPLPVHLPFVLQSWPRPCCRRRLPRPPRTSR